MDITYEPTFNGYPINTDREKGMGCYTKGLAILQDKLESMIEKHSKLLLTGVVLRYPQDGSVEASSRDFTLFNKNLTRDLERNNILPETGRLRGKKRNESNNAPKHQVDPSVTIVCEKHGKDKNPHAHVIIMVNGNAKRDPRDVQKRASRAWEAALGVENGSGLVHYCEKSHFLDRTSSDFQQSANESFYHNSYPFKVRGKEHSRKGAWMIRGTRSSQTNGATKSQ